MNFPVIGAIMLSALFSSCTPEHEMIGCKSDLHITETSTAYTGTRASGINSTIQCYGPNLCYSFSHVEIKEKQNKEFEIRVKANVPCKPTVCAQALYQANPTINIKTPEAGTYILQFYNRDVWFKSDTVIVN